MKRNIHFRKARLFLLLPILLLAVACSSVGVEPEVETIVEVEAGAEPQTIEFWIPAGRGRDEGVAAVVEAFTAKNPNITVEVTAIPFNEFRNSLQVAYASDNPPDAAMLDGVEVQNLAFNGALLPITEMLSDEDRADFMTDLVDMVSFDGEVYALPWAQASVTMLYNVDMFDAAGIEVPQTLEDGWTWPEFKDNITAVVAAQEEETWGIMSFQSPMTGAFFPWTMVRSNSEPGSPLWDGISDDFTTVEGFIDTPEALEAYEFYQSLYTDGLAPRDNVPDAFGNGLVATYYVVPGTASVMNRNFPDLNWGVMPTPYFKTPLTHTGSFAPGISAKSDNPEAAKAFIQYFTSVEGYVTYHEVTPSLPGRKSVQTELPELQEGYLALLFEQAIEWGQARPGGPAYSAFNVIIASNMMRDIALGADIEETVANAIVEAEAQMAQFK